MHPTHKPAQPVGVGIDPVELTPAEVLHGAALYIQRHGLHRGEMFANLRAATPAACAQGGLKMAVCGGPDVTWTPAGDTCTWTIRRTRITRTSPAFRLSNRRSRR